MTGKKTWVMVNSFKQRELLKNVAVKKTWKGVFKQKLILLNSFLIKINSINFNSIKIIYSTAEPNTYLKSTSNAKKVAEKRSQTP
jgi:hypothetical protein